MRSVADFRESRSLLREINALLDEHESLVKQWRCRWDEVPRKALEDFLRRTRHVLARVEVKKQARGWKPRTT